MSGEASRYEQLLSTWDGPAAGGRRPSDRRVPLLGRPYRWTLTRKSLSATWQLA